MLITFTDHHLNYIRRLSPAKASSTSMARTRTRRNANTHTPTGKRQCCGQRSTSTFSSTYTESWTTTKVQTKATLTKASTSTRIQYASSTVWGSTTVSAGTVSWQGIVRKHYLPRYNIFAHSSIIYSCICITLMPNCICILHINAFVLLSINARIFIIDNYIL